MKQLCVGADVPNTRPLKEPLGIRTMLAVVVSLLTIPGSLFGQGYMDFVNFPNTRVSTNGTSLGLASGPVGTWYYALLWEPYTQLFFPNNADPSLDGWTFGALATNTTAAGRFNGNANSDHTAVAVLGTEPDITYNWIVVGWSANLGTDWNAVFEGRPTSLVPDTGGQQGIASWTSTGSLNGGWYGISRVDEELNSSPVDGPYSFPLESSEVPGMTLSYYATPEPRSFALIALGASLLFVFRRRA